MVVESSEILYKIYYIILCIYYVVLYMNLYFYVFVRGSCLPLTRRLNASNYVFEIGPKMRILGVFEKYFIHIIIFIVLIYYRCKE